MAIGLGVFTLLAGVIGGKLLFFPEPTPVSLTEDVEVRFSGINGLGKARIMSSDTGLDYTEKTKDFLDSITYTITPDANLRNGQTVTLTASWDPEAAQTANLQITQSEEKLEVSGLQEPDEKAAEQSEEESVQEKKDPEEEYKEIETKVEETRRKEEEAEKQAVKEIQEEQAGHWIQGKSQTETHFENKKFLKRHYGQNAETALEKAQEYGESSSQFYQLVPIIENKEVLGTEVQFRPEEPDKK